MLSLFSPATASRALERKRACLALVASALLPFATAARAQTSTPEPVQSPAPESAAPSAVAISPHSTPSPDDAAEPKAVSQVRIVRLSQARGVVQMDRNTGRGFEAAFANIPVIAGAQLRTAMGVAEVEFEDNSSLRLTPDSEVRFTELGRAADGSTLTDINVIRGTVYADVEKTRGNLFVLTDSTAHMALAPGTHLRFDATRSNATELAVLNGQVALTLNGVNTVIAKHQTVALNLTEQTIAVPQRGISETAFDGWDKQESSYHQLKSGLAGSGGVGLFGANDLNYYGSFADTPGCGSLWRPYFASAAWDPFASGVWTWYPSAGYSWVSPYPWGWLPFHSGSWVSCGSAGWGWRPAGGQWYGLNNTVTMRIARHPIHPVPVAPGPRTGVTAVPVNMHQLPVSGGTLEQGFTFRRDSAGLGVPRSTFGNLRGTSNTVAHRGIATNSFASRPESAAFASPGPGMSAGRTAAVRGSSPAPSSSHSTGSFGSASSAGGRPSAPVSMPSGGSYGGASGSAHSAAGGAHK